MTVNGYDSIFQNDQDTPRHDRVGRCETLRVGEDAADKGVPRDSGISVIASINPC